VNYNAKMLMHGAEREEKEREERKRGG